MSEDGKPKFTPDNLENKERERERSQNLIWGEGYPTVENHSKRMGCMNPGCSQYEKSLSIKELGELVVGVRPAPTALQFPGKNLAVVCECSECFEKFWFHASDTTAKAMLWMKK